MLQDGERTPKAAAGGPVGVPELIRTSNQFVQLGQGKKAVTILVPLWESDDDRTPEVALALVRAYDSIGEHDGARELLQAARNVWPVEPGIEIAVAKREFAAGSYRSACDIVAPVLRSADAPLEAYLVMADAQLKLEQPANALETLAEAESRLGATPLLLRLKADGLVAEGRDAEALAELRKATLRWPANAQLRRLLATCLLKAGDFEAAARTLGPSLIDPSAARAADLLLFADACVRAELFAELAQTASAAALRWPDGDRWAVAILSAAAALDRRDLFADPRLRLTAPLSPLALSLARSHAMQLVKRRRLAAAADLLDALLRIDENAAPLLRLRARLHEWQGEDARALQAFEELREAGRLSGADALAYATFLSQTEDPEPAREAYGAAVETAHHPALRARARLEFAQFLLSLGETGEAAAQLDRAAEDASTDVQRQKIDWLRRYLPAKATVAAADAVPPDEVLDGGAIAHYRFADDRCIVWFGGVTPANLGPFEQACLPIWRRLGISVMTVTDLRRLASLQGFGPYFPDRGAAQGRLTEILSTRGYRRFAMKGTSLSGYAAILYGCRMGAAGALSYSGIGFLPSPDEMEPSGLLRLKRVLRSTDLETFDLKPLLADHPDFVVHHHFGADAGFDVAQARHLESLPNVRLFGQQHERHNSLAWLDGQGLLESGIEAFAREVL